MADSHQWDDDFPMMNILRSMHLITLGVTDHANVMIPLGFPHAVFVDH
jgi:hypothetical protein